MPKTPAQKKAQAAYMEKFSRISVRVTPDQHERIKAHAAARKESTNEFVLRAIDSQIERDNEAQTAHSGLGAAPD